MVFAADLKRNGVSNYRESATVFPLGWNYFKLNSNVDSFVSKTNEIIDNIAFVLFAYKQTWLPTNLITENNLNKSFQTQIWM